MEQFLRTITTLNKLLSSSVKLQKMQNHTKKDGPTFGIFIILQQQVIIYSSSLKIMMFFSQFNIYNLKRFTKNIKQYSNIVRPCQSSLRLLDKIAGFSFVWNWIITIFLMMQSRFQLRLTLNIQNGLILGETTLLLKESNILSTVSTNT